MYNVVFHLTLNDSAGNELWSTYGKVENVLANKTGYCTLPVDGLSSDEWERVDIKKSTCGYDSSSYGASSNLDTGYDSFDNPYAFSGRDYSKKLSVKKVGTGDTKNIWF